MKIKILRKLKEQLAAAVFIAVESGEIATFGGDGTDSYCVSYKAKQLSVSIASAKGKASQLMLPFLKDSYGEPTKVYTVPNSMRPDLTVTYWIWDNKEISFERLKSKLRDQGPRR